MSQKFNHIESLCAIEAKVANSTEAHKNPIYASSTFQFETIQQGVEIFQNQPGQHVYTRYGNPGIESIAQKISDLETFGMSQKGFGLLTSSGMAAIHIAIHSTVSAGDLVITQGNLYGGTTELLYKIFEPQGIKIQSLDLGQLDNLESILKSNAAVHKIIFLETPANPSLQCLDLEQICSLGHKYNAKIIVDNTFATPILQQPFKYGADVIIHSTTKYIHGHGLSTGGVVITMDESLFRNHIWNSMKLMGCNSNPFDAWLIGIGIKTLAIRMEKQCDNAWTLAQKLIQHPKISRVHYPGLESHPSHTIAKKQMKHFGAMLSFAVGSNFEDAVRFCNHLNLCTIAPSLGETDTMILHPASMSHLKVSQEVRAYYGITDNLIRMSVGLEHPEDIWEDLNKALYQI